MPKQLLLMRHAHAGWERGQTDFERPLNELGLIEATRMGAYLRQEDLKPDLIISSPALRTRQTSERVIRELGMEISSVEFEPSIYEAQPSALLEIIQAIPLPATRVLMIGHNPAISQIASWLTQKPAINMPPATIAFITLETENWREIKTCPAELQTIIGP